MNSNVDSFAKSNPLQADFYADDSVQETVVVVENVEVAQGTWRLRFRCPAIAATAQPGQFIMLRLADRNDPLIGRPLAVYNLHQDEAGNWSDIDVVYLVKGNLTTHLVNAEPGEKLVVWGPLGNGFRPSDTRHLIMVAGGIGQTPFLCLAREYLGLQKFGRECPPAQQVTFCYGARNAKLLAGVDDFQQIGVNTQICTDDGSAGVQGLVTDVLEQVLQTDAEVYENNQGVQVVCCGPEPMMEAVAKVAKQWSVPCQVSLETPMACGIGICFSCVTRCKESDGSWDYKRTCVDGPVFDAERIVWE